MEEAMDLSQEKSTQYFIFQKIAFFKNACCLAVRKTFDSKCEESSLLG
jgi:hypothetical protein